MVCLLTLVLMKEPSIFHYGLLVLFCLGVALAGLYFLANFGRLFKSTIKNEWLRKNAAAWVIILCISLSMAPMSGGFYYLALKYGWWKSIGGTLLVTTANTVVGFNLTRLVSENKRLQKYSFVWHKIVVVITVIILSLIINIPLTDLLYGSSKEFITYSVIAGVYIGGATGLIYAITSYLDLERK